MKDGRYDTLKGSYYANCSFYDVPQFQKLPTDKYRDSPEFTSPNVWPPEAVLPGFAQAFADLCNFIIDIAALVARACDEYALSKIEGYESSYLQRIVKESYCTKARFLHYFPSQSSKPCANDEVYDAH